MRVPPSRPNAPPRVALRVTLLLLAPGFASGCYFRPRWDPPLPIESAQDGEVTDGGSDEALAPDGLALDASPDATAIDGARLDGVSAADASLDAMASDGARPADTRTADAPTLDGSDASNTPRDVVSPDVLTVIDVPAVIDVPPRPDVRIERDAGPAPDVGSSVDDAPAAPDVAEPDA